MRLKFSMEVKCWWGCVCVTACTHKCIIVRGHSYCEFALVVFPFSLNCNMQLNYNMDKYYLTYLRHLSYSRQQFFIDIP